MTSPKLDSADEDRLPWLETADDDYHEGPSALHIALVVAALLAVIAAAILGYQLIRNARDTSGNGALIAAQEGDYKVKPNDPGGLKVEGEGNSAIATSAGKNAGSGAIDLKAVPEAPVTGQHPRAGAASTIPAGGHNAVAQVPVSGGKLIAAAPVAPARAPAAGSGGGGGGSLVQLGAFPSEAVANAAWASFSKRFAYLAPLGKSVQPVAMGGKTLYRLRVNAGSANQAADICGRLKVAGEACLIAN